MSIYPVFAYEKINERYHKDIRQFLMPKENETDPEKVVREVMDEFMKKQNLEIQKQCGFIINKNQNRYGPNHLV